MNRPSDPIRDNLIESYLDRALRDREREAIEERLLRDPQFEREVELQGRIDAALKHLFPAVDADDRETELARQVAAGQRPVLPLARRPGWWVAAAAVAVVVAGWWLYDPPAPAPHFAPTPLAIVYRQTVERGFEPYYECDEPARFAEVFANRQGRPLELRKMPPGSRMLGLSYPGGLSRHTTAMLCEMDGQRVMVFVDRVEADQPSAADVPSDLPTHVFREVREGLVFYEVTPFDQPRATAYLVVAE